MFYLFIYFKPLAAVDTDDFKMVITGCGIADFHLILSLIYSFLKNLHLNLLRIKPELNIMQLLSSIGNFSPYLELYLFLEKQAGYRIIGISAI